MNKVWLIFYQMRDRKAALASKIVVHSLVTTGENENVLAGV